MKPRCFSMHNTPCHRGIMGKRGTKYQRAAYRQGGHTHSGTYPFPRFAQEKHYLSASK